MDEQRASLTGSLDAAGQLKAFADQLRSAAAAHAEAVVWLTGAAPVVEAGLVPLPVALRFADATRELADALARPTDSSALREKEAAVRSALAEFIRPFRPDAIAALRKRAEG